MTHETSSFPVTDWSLLRRLGGDEDSAARQLDLGELVTRYVPAMRRFLLQRFRGESNEVDDWLQGFLASKVLQSALLSRADRERGKFRSFLSHALSDYVLDQMRRAKLRNGAGTLGDSHLAPTCNDPSLLFDRHWAEHAIAEALRLTRERLYATRRGPAWEVFSRRLLVQGEDARDYRALASEFGFEKPSQAAVALNTAKRIFRRKLADVLVEFGATEGDLNAAIDELKIIFQK